MTTGASAHLTLPVSDRDHVQGSPAATVTLVEYGDYQCPHCGRAYPMVEELRRKFGARMRFVFRNFPLTQLHEHAQLAAEAAEAAAAQGRFWEMHQALFTHQNALDPAHLVAEAERLGLDTARFSKDLATHAFRQRVREDFMSGVRSGVNGTPTFFINEMRYDGPNELASLSESIESEPNRDMKIGIIGAGEIGGTLTRRFTALGHKVSVANSRGPETLTSLARETGARAVTARDAAKAGEVVIVTIPEGQIANLPKDLFAGVPRDVVVVDTGNYYPGRDGRIAAIENGMIESRWVARRLGRPVIKAFNTMNYRRLLEGGRPRGAPGRMALPVAGDDQGAKRVVMRLVDELGFDPVDDGGLDDSWRQQPGTPVYDIDRDAAAVRRALTEASPERRPEWRATPDRPLERPLL